MDRLIEVKVNGNYITKDNKNAGVQGEYNITAMRIEFDPGWDGFAKHITFWDAKGQNPVEVILTADKLDDITQSTRVYLVLIPGEPLREVGECVFVIDGYIDGVRQRSVEDRLTVKPARSTDDAVMPADPTPSQAEQLQVQIDNMLPPIQEQAILATNAATSAAESASEAASAATNAETSATNAASSAASVADSVENARASAESAAQSAGEAEAAKTAAEKAAADAQAIAGGDFASVAYVDNKAATAESNANTYTDQKIAAIPTPDVSGQINDHNTATDAHADIRQAVSNAASAAANAQTTANSKEASGTAETKVSAHNADTTAHGDIRVAVNGKASTATYTVDVSETWTEDATNGGYYQTVAVNGILESDNPIADVILGSDIDANATYLAAWGCVTRITTANNSITLYANGDAPASAFTVQLKVVR